MCAVTEDLQCSEDKYLIESIDSYSSRETYEFARKLGEEATEGMIFCLNGDMGVGKTVFAQGFAAGLGITEPVNSPTFTIMQAYPEGRLTLYHFDVYRIADIEEMDEIGYEDCFFGEGVCLIEWSELIEEIIPQDAVKIWIEKDLKKGTEYRKISVWKQE